MRLSSGTRLGPYEVVSPLGSGGMGEVYRARDSRLGRDVAIKVLPQHLNENPEVHARFEREARTISSLNHPHICTLHDVGREGETDFLVMELIEGETLADRLERGPLPLAEALRLGIQIADALDRAHRAGIIHRDFKPGNVMLTRSGAKLMDFGLARPTGMSGTGGGSGVSIAGLTQSPTRAAPLTAEGTIVGTFLYMAPEQLEGRETDVRSDLWALGCVLYEMLTGRRAFEGKSQASLIGSIMHAEPAPIPTLAPLTPPQLESLVRACLTKDPEERIQTAHDVKLQLGWIAQSSSQSSGVAAAPAVRRVVKRETVAWAVAAVAIAIAAPGYFLWRPPNDGALGGEPLRFVIPTPPAVVTMDMPRISPDGRAITFAALDTLNRTMVWVRPLSSLTANPIPGTEGARSPFWSPDGKFLGFIANGKLKKIMIHGGPATVICDAPTGSDGTWGKNGDILFDGGGLDPIWRVRASGGVATTAMRGDSTNQVGWPAFLPDGRHYFYTVIRVGSSPELMLGTLDDSTGQALGITASRVEYSPDGYLVFARDRTLLAQRFNAGRRKLEGEPFPVAEDLPVGGNASANFTVSRNGVLVYRATGDARGRLVWFDRTGRELAEIAPAADFRAPALSPDGKRIAIRRTDAGNLDLAMIEPGRGTSTRFTFDPGQDGNPIWSPDGSRIAWTASSGDASVIHIKSASGLGEVQSLALGAAGAATMDWFRNEDRLLYQVVNTATGYDIFTIAIREGAKPEPLIRTPFIEGRGRLSPDGRWLAYESWESGRAEVFVTSLQGAAGKWQISARGGSEPCWSRDGRELFYLSADQQLMAMPVIAGESLQPATPQPLFRVITEPGNRRNVYDVSPDGRFLFLVPASEQSTPMTVVVNWRGGEERR